jgi:hypothetical protein
MVCLLRPVSLSNEARDIGWDTDQIVKKILIPGEGGWDFLAVDAAARRLYVSRGTKVEILNLESGDLLSCIPTSGVHGIAIAPDLDHGFIGDWAAARNSRPRMEQATCLTISRTKAS